MEFFLLLDRDGDYILVENDSDLHAIIQMNKRKCTAGESVRLYVIDLPQKSSPIGISPTDSTSVKTIFKLYTSKISLI